MPRQPRLKVLRNGRSPKRFPLSQTETYVRDLRTGLFCTAPDKPQLLNSDEQRDVICCFQISVNTRVAKDE